MLTGVRAVILMSAGIAVLATYLLAAQLTDAALWTALAAVACLPVVVLSLSNMLPRAQRG